MHLADRHTGSICAMSPSCTVQLVDARSRVKCLVVFRLARTSPSYRAQGAFLIVAQWRSFPVSAVVRTEKLCTNFNVSDASKVFRLRLSQKYFPKTDCWITSVSCVHSESNVHPDGSFERSPIHSKRTRCAIFRSRTSSTFDSQDGTHQECPERAPVYFGYQAQPI